MKSYFLSNGYTFNPDECLWHRPEYAGINYNDGDEIEKRLQVIISGANDVSVMSLELAKSCTDWPSLYHLSRKRVNLLRPFEERFLGKRVLEVGAGCGAITRYLGEIGADVVALEGSRRRAAIVASRCRDLSNITVVAEVVHHFNPEPRFDVVTLIGVLEYARKFFPGNGADPVDAMLSYIKGLLNPGGLLIIAIENQLGLKYFAGFPEDHVGKSMFGIEDHYSQRGVVTFGRRELAGRVNKAGLREQEWWFPFPDYKLPTLMVSEVGISPPEGIDLTPVIRNACMDDPQYPPNIHFSLERALRPIIRNGLLGDVANSFVLLATENNFMEKPEIPLAVHFATERRPEFAKKVVFTRRNHGVGYTSPIALYPTSEIKGISSIVHRLVGQEFVRGELWLDRLIQIMTTPGWTITQLEEWVKVWLDAFCNVVKIDLSCNMIKKKISGQYLDLIPRNLIVDENGQTTFIDQEWVVGDELEVGYVFFRALFSSIYALGRIAQTGENALPSYLSLIKILAERFGFVFSEDEVQYFHNLECDFQQLVVGNSRLSYEVMAARQFIVPRSYGHNSEAHGQIVVLKQALLEKEKQIEILMQAVKDLDEEFIRLNGMCSEKKSPQKAFESMIDSNSRNPSLESEVPQVPHIVAIVNDPICSQIRILQALRAGAKNSLLTGTVQIEGAEGSHPQHLPSGPGTTWIVQRTCRINIQDINNNRSPGTRMVHDVDDLLWKIPEDNQNYRVVNKELVTLMMRLLEMADCVTTSTIPLQQALEKLGIAATVLPNCLVPEEWKNLVPHRRMGPKPRVGWAGQVGVHRSDLQFLNSVIQALGNEVEWIFLGEIPEGLCRTGITCAVHPMVPLSEFPQKLASLNFDLALAPLALNAFNEAKSDLRLLQYGILGYPIVATDIYPHQEAPVTRVPNDTQAWARAIREHLYDRDCSENQGEKLREWVLENRMLDSWLPHYLRAWMGKMVEINNSSTLLENWNHQVQPPTPSYLPKLKARYDCSIIIPVFNNVELTRQCLTRLAEVTDGYSYEVIVVDNHSTDGTNEFLATLSGDVRIISNPDNYGFAKACNQGAAMAKGRFLVFLNNDTIPKAGWLRALVDEVLQHPDVAIVGSKLLYPDDTIQHAGVVFSKNCFTPYHVFRGAQADSAAVNLRREFQVVTAACMLIRREEFHAVGGFDEVYRNGFEDVDLCLKVGQRGKKIIYQPESVLYHLEHQTPGRKNPEAEQHNARVLMERWQSSIVVDEDLYTVPAGFANRYYFRDGWLRQSLEPFQHEAEKKQWQRVQKMQELLLNDRHKRNQGVNYQHEKDLQALLSDHREWPDDKEVLQWAARLCQSFKLFHEERVFWQRVLTFGADRAVRERLVTLCLRMHDLIEAAHHIQVLLKDHPHDGAGHWFQGILLMQSQTYAEAVHAFRKALECGYDARKTGIGLGMAIMGMGELEEAWKRFDQVRINYPDDAEAIDGLIQSGTLLQRWKELSQRLSHFLERNPADCDRRFALAGVEFRAGRMESARYHFQMLTLVKPDFEGLEALRALLHTGPENMQTSPAPKEELIA